MITFNNVCLKYVEVSFYNGMCHLFKWWYCILHRIWLTSLLLRLPPPWICYFYTVARSLSIVFNVIFTFLILGNQTSLTTCSTLLLVMFGFYLGIDGEVNFSLMGTTAGVISSVFVSLNGIFTSKILAKVNDDKSLLLFYNNVNAMFLFVPLIIFFEKDVSNHWLPLWMKLTSDIAWVNHNNS